MSLCKFKRYFLANNNHSQKYKTVLTTHLQLKKRKKKTTTTTTPPFPMKKQNNTNNATMILRWEKVESCPHFKPHSQIVLHAFLVMIHVYVCIFIPKLVLKDISAQTVQGNVHLTVNLTHVNMQMDHVLVLQVGWVKIVPQVILFKKKSTITIS